MNMPGHIRKNKNGSLKKSYIYSNSQILAQHDGNSSDPRYLYLHDRLGSVRLVINNEGVAQNSYTYNPFGESFDTECTENVTNPFKFTGQWFDSEIEQYYLRARQYDPALMRFTARDPAEAVLGDPLTLHRYLYCKNNSINYIDPPGEFFFTLMSVFVSRIINDAVEYRYNAWTIRAYTYAVGVILDLGTAYLTIQWAQNYMHEKEKGSIHSIGRDSNSVEDFVEWIQGGNPGGDGG